MANPRHATPITGSDPHWRRLLNDLKAYRPGRLQAGALMLASCLVILGLSTSIQSQDNDTADQTANSVSNSGRTVIELALGNDNSVETADAIVAGNEPDQHEASRQPANTPITAPAKTAAAINTPHINSERRRTETIKPGDNLSTVFQRVGLSDRDVYHVVKSSSEGKDLTKMFPGEKLQFVFDGKDDVQQILRVVSPLKTIYFSRGETDGKTSYTTEIATREPEVRQVYRTAQISDSLSLSAGRADLSQAITINMANIFSGVIDFVLDVRNGDQFTVIYEELYLDGEKFDEGDIVAAQYINRGKVYNAYRYTDPKGDSGYFNEDGVSMRKAFLRAPLDFTRISSGFNLRRLHPITKQVKPHRGIDYAAPRGTPVFSTGAGRVVASGYNASNGKYVFVRHGESYVTKYLHLKRRNVKKGQRVKQGQIIGQVGCTGLCTGPHLHYEFLVNGVHRNPRTILKKLPKAKSLEPQYKDNFLAAIKPAQLQIASYGAGNLKLAARE